MTLLLEGDAYRHRHHVYLHWFWGMKRGNLTLLLSAPSRVEASMSPEQEASSVLEDLKRLITTSDWALGGLVVIGIFCLVFIALILFAAIFGCCTSPRHKRGRL